MAPVSASAQQDYASFLQRLSQANRMQPLQNPEYTRGQTVLNWNILDRRNKVVGEVDDVIIGARGGITSISADFNRLRLGQKVYLNYGKMSIRPASNGYVLGYADDQIENLYPSLLADIETASGIDADNFSAVKLIGAPVVSDDKRKLGTVEDILFTGNGTRAAALYVNLTHGTTRGKTTAIPFDLVQYDPGRNDVKVMLTAEQADALIDYLSEEN
jgi:sporulation protein YlmC with PRC-barrel domain